MNAPLKSKKEIKSHMAATSLPVQIVNISDIEVDHTWNSRQGNWQNEDGGPDESTGVKGLAESIKTNGQDTPIDVRPNPNPKGLKFKLVTGHRRFEAIKLLAERKDAPPTIKATIHENMSDADARSLNLRENLTRDNIEPVDACFAIGELLKQSPKPKAEEIAKSTGKSIPYAYGMINIAEKVAKPILNRWRTDLRSTLTVGMMQELAKIDKDKQEAILLKMLEEEPEKTKQGDWKGSAKKRAAALGKIFGYLARDYGVDFSEVDWIKALEDGILFKVKTTATKRDKSAIEKFLTKALEDATAEPLPGEDEEEDESEEPSK